MEGDAAKMQAAAPVVGEAMQAGAMPENPKPDFDKGCDEIMPMANLFCAGGITACILSFLTCGTTICNCCFACPMCNYYCALKKLPEEKDGDKEIGCCFNSCNNTKVFAQMKTVRICMIIGLILWVINLAWMSGALLNYLFAYERCDYTSRASCSSCFENKLDFKFNREFTGRGESYEENPEARRLRLLAHHTSGTVEEFEERDGPSHTLMQALGASMSFVPASVGGVLLRNNIVEVDQLLRLSGLEDNVEFGDISLAQQQDRLLSGNKRRLDQTYFLNGSSYANDCGTSYYSPPECMYPSLGANDNYSPAHSLQSCARGQGPHNVTGISDLMKGIYSVYYNVDGTCARSNHPCKDVHRKYPDEKGGKPQYWGPADLTAAMINATDLETMTTSCTREDMQICAAFVTDDPDMNGEITDDFKLGADLLWYQYRHRGENTAYLDVDTMEWKKPVQFHVACHTSESFASGRVSPLNLLFGNYFMPASYSECETVCECMSGTLVPNSGKRLWGYLGLLFLIITIAISVMSCVLMVKGHQKLDELESKWEACKDYESKYGQNAQMQMMMANMAGQQMAMQQQMMAQQQQMAQGQAPPQL